MSAEKKDTKIEMKRKCAEEAIRYVRKGMVLGVGSGSTIQEFIALLEKSTIDPQTIVCIPSSYDTEKLLISNGLKIGSLNQFPVIDVTVDGADRVDKKLNCIKGGGGALLREKIIATAAKKLIIIVDESKIVPSLEGTFPIPVEVIPHARAFVERKLESIKGKPKLRLASDKLGPTITDNGNIILDTAFDEIADPAKLERILNNIPGVMENGLFPKELVHQVIIGHSEGVKVLGRT